MQLHVIYRKQKHLQTLIYLSVCVGENTKQQRGDDVPCQAFCGVGGLLNAVTGSHCRRALHLTDTLSSPLHSSFPPSLLLPQDSNNEGKATEWSPLPTLTTGEHARERERPRQALARERGGMDC